MRYDELTNEPRPLLGRLQAQIDDDKDFAWAVQNVGGTAPEVFREICHQMFADLYDTAGGHWADLRDPLNNAWTPKFSGMAVVEHYGPLHSDWNEHFSKAILNVADSPETERDDRNFLYFMLGVLRCGWHEYIRQNHAGRIKE